MNDAAYYAERICAEQYRYAGPNFRKNFVNEALLDAGLLTEAQYRSGKLPKSFTYTCEAEKFFVAMCGYQDEGAVRKHRKVWLGRRELVDTYCETVKNYLKDGNYELILDSYGKNPRNNLGGFLRKYDLKPKHIISYLLKSLCSSDFAYSVRNASTRNPSGHGTFFMTFAPRVKVRGEKIDLYIKMVINPHPFEGRHNLQIVSFHETTRCITTLYTGKIRMPSELPGYPTKEQIREKHMAG